MSKPSNSRYFYIATLLASLYYTTVTLKTPLRENPLKISPDQLFQLRLKIIAQILFIWIIGTYGVARFKAYASSIKDSPDGAGFNKVANGLMCLLYGSILTSLYTVT